MAAGKSSGGQEAVLLCADVDASARKAGRGRKHFQTVADYVKYTHGLNYTDKYTTTKTKTKPEGKAQLVAREK